MIPTTIIIPNTGAGYFSTAGRILAEASGIQPGIYISSSRTCCRPNKKQTGGNKYKSTRRKKRNRHSLRKKKKKFTNKIVAKHNKKRPRLF